MVVVLVCAGLELFQRLVTKRLVSAFWEVSREGVSPEAHWTERRPFIRKETLFSQREIIKRLGDTVHDHGGKLAKSGRE